ncbi:MAG: hypothetical protein PWQ37_2790 [Candidatus Petromonas sp.]|jgi:hypothetical protein|nr:hypothetical protein [Candidatus Petromonas sp.]
MKNEIDLTKVKKVKQLYDAEKLNDFLKNGWSLLEIAKNPNGATYVIGQTHHGSCQQ